MDTDTDRPQSGDTDGIDAGAGSDVSRTSSDTGLRKSRRGRPRLPRTPESTELDISDLETDVERDTIVRPRKVLRRTLSHIQVTPLAYPRSAYEGWTPPLEPSNEATAISDLKAAFDDAHANANEPPEYTYFRLDDFSIYHLHHHKRLGHEMVTLSKLLTRGGYDEFVFDGTLSAGDRRHYVQGVRFPTMAVDGYGDRDIISLRDHISIQSPRAHVKDVWYKLGRPSKVYERFHQPFLWLAQFTKYFADYLLRTKAVTLHHFRSQFSRWLNKSYGWSVEFQDWLNECNYLTDFRTTVAAHVAYLWKECWSIDDPQAGLTKHPVWYEVDPYKLCAIPRQEAREEKTIVTPFVYDCFRRMYFYEHMEIRSVSQLPLARIVEEKRALGLTPFGASQAPEVNLPTPQSLAQIGSDEVVDVRVGDVVRVRPDTRGPWRNTGSPWFAYVHNVRHETMGTLLDVLWLYQPHDTTLGKAYYPFQNELFMSDNCECGKRAVDLATVIDKVEVIWFASDPSAHSGLFVRQKFRTIRDEDTYDFVSLKQSDFECRCLKKVPIFEECRRNHQIDDYVLVRNRNSELREDSLEPAQILDFDLDARRVVVRLSERKNKHDRSARPNELVWSDQRLSKPPTTVIRKCYVVSFTRARVNLGLPTPYDRGGAGDYFFTVQEDIDDLHTNDGHNGGSEARTEAESYDKATDCFDKVNRSSSVRETTIDRTSSSNVNKLRGLGMFCGGGNFDRGLEDGGAVEFRYAVDWDPRAIHSYRANVEDPKRVRFFSGSVNDYLARAMAGSWSKDIAGVGDVDCISAGSPCPGFSRLQLYKQSFQSLRNASMVASVVSHVDFYCPRYCILENVVTMTQGSGANKDENVFAQILAALVALGYQTQQFLMDAWNYGSSESRSRVFIIASAPDLEPLPHPQHTHAHPGDVPMTKLGESSNGLPFGVRREDCTPFQHVSPAIATADLPDIGDGQPQICPAFPDHRTPSEEIAESRARIAAVPVWPHGMGLLQAAHKQLISGAPLKWCKELNSTRKTEISKTYSRVYRNWLFPTVTTALRIQCAFSGRTLHWSQHRCLTIMELKRSQGFLDEDVLIGTPRDQVHVIGNSVERNVSLALGLSLKVSWTNSKHNITVSYLADKESTRLPSEEDLTPPPSDEGDISHLPDELSRWPAELQLRAAPYNGSGNGNATKTYTHRVTLSQEETLRIRADPVHGFQVIEQIIKERQDETLQHNGNVESREAVIDAPTQKEAIA